MNKILSTNPTRITGKEGFFLEEVRIIKLKGNSHKIRSTRDSLSVNEPHSQGMYHSFLLFILEYNSFVFSEKYCYIRFFDMRGKIVLLLTLKS